MHSAVAAKVDEMVKVTPTNSQAVDNNEEYRNVAERIVKAISTRQYSQVASCFTLDGLERYNKLIAYGTGRIVGSPELQFFHSVKNKVVVRGLQMSFSFLNAQKKRVSFVEDVVLTLNDSKKVENVSFGLGAVAEKDILTKYAPGWRDDTRELLMEFLENYKTAYCLKDTAFIRAVFDDDAIIIVGNVVKKPMTALQGEKRITIEGQNIIKYNRYTKSEYMDHLNYAFKRNEFINVKFNKSDVKMMSKYYNKENNFQEIFGIQLGQEYSSSRYADVGYLFLLVNMTNHDEPLINVRTWQPNEVDTEKLFNAGDFYK